MHYSLAFHDFKDNVALSDQSANNDWSINNPSIFTCQNPSGQKLMPFHQTSAGQFSAANLNKIIS
jgi:hypothetical protein